MGKYLFKINNKNITLKSMFILPVSIFDHDHVSACREESLNETF